jgi:deoxyribodipyrimidine photolyase
VWLKRDLCVTDHPALSEAAARARRGAVFTLFLFEPEVLAQPEWDSSPRSGRRVSRTAADRRRPPVRLVKRLE